MERYVAVADSTHRTFEFWSEGPNGAIRKIVRYRHLDMGIYNLGFGDWNEKSLLMEDKARSNNLDRDKVLATVAFTVLDFMKFHPGITVFIEGSTGSRTRLYQIQIKSLWHWISQLVYVEGFVKDKWEPFRKDGSYEAFMVSLR